MLKFSVLDWVLRLPVVGFRARRAHGRLRALNEEARALLRRAEAHPFRPDPNVSGWSPAQHIHHTATINAAILPWLRAQCDAPAPPSPEEARGAPNALGYALLLSGRIPRGQARTPGRYAPPEHPGEATLRALLSENADALRALEACLPRLSALESRRTHPRLGRLNAREWLRFAEVHTRHHARIVREIVGARG